MRKLTGLILLMAIGFAAVAQKDAGDAAEIEAIRKVIQTAYVEGLQNEGDTVKINSGFDPGFEMLMPGKDGALEKYSLAEWKKKIAERLASGKLPRKGDEKISVRFLFVDVTGNAAVAKFEFFAGTRLTFVDYQFLYKFPDGWKIVSKIFHKF